MVITRNNAGLPITPRQMDVLLKIAYGLSSKQIAHQLAIKINTVKNHRKDMLKKTGAKNCAELVRKLVQNVYEK